MNGIYGGRQKETINIKVVKYKPPLHAFYFKKETESSSLIEVTIPALRVTDHSKPWVSVLGKLTKIGYY